MFIIMKHVKNCETREISRSELEWRDEKEMSTLLIRNCGTPWRVNNLNSLNKWRKERQSTPWPVKWFFLMRLQKMGRNDGIRKGENTHICRGRQKMCLLESAVFGVSCLVCTHMHTHTHILQRVSVKSPKSYVYKLFDSLLNRADRDVRM